MRVFLPCTGFAPGQTIPIKVECSNMSPRNVLDLTFSLVKEIRYHAKKPWKKTRTEKSVIAALQTTTGIDSGEERTILESLNVPPVPPSELVNCQIIDVLYKIKVEAFVSGMAKNSKNSTFIRIGTVPIYEKMGILNGKSVGYPQASSSEDPPSYYQAQTQLLNIDMRKFGNMHKTRNAIIDRFAPLQMQNKSDIKGGIKKRKITSHACFVNCHHL